jgi:hypothetical protein
MMRRRRVFENVALGEVVVNDIFALVGVTLLAALDA